MAKRWQPAPDAPLGKQERVGRRLFDEPELRGVEGQPNLGVVSLSQFREKRGREVSLDRLGRTGIEPKVKNYLVPRCDYQASSFGKQKQFEGWATIKVADLTNKWSETPQWTAHPSPVMMDEDEELTENVYHAHTVCSESRADAGTALFLRHLFERYGSLEIVQREERNAFATWDRLIRYCRNAYEQIAAKLRPTHQRK